MVVPPFEGQPIRSKADTADERCSIVTWSLSTRSSCHNKNRQDFPQSHLLPLRDSALPILVFLEYKVLYRKLTNLYPNMHCHLVWVEKKSFIHVRGLTFGKSSCLCLWLCALVVYYGTKSPALGAFLPPVVIWGCFTPAWFRSLISGYISQVLRSLSKHSGSWKTISSCDYIPVVDVIPKEGARTSSVYDFINRWHISNILSTSVIETAI